MGTRDEEWARIEGVLRTEAEAIARLPQALDRGAVARCVTALERCRGRIITIGAGTSAAAARKVAHSLCCIERPAFFLSPADAPHGALGAVAKGDVAIVFSKGGRTAELNRILAPLRAKGAYLVAVTENERSPLARASDLVLRVRVAREADPFNLLATASTLAVIAVFDAICVALMSRGGYTRGASRSSIPGERSASACGDAPGPEIAVFIILNKKRKIS